MSSPSSHWTSGLGSVRTGQQSRSKATQLSLLDAAEQLFAEQGVNATTLAQITERADSSVGAFYHHFRNKRTVEQALFKRFIEDYENTALAAVDPSRWEGAQIGDILHAYVQFSLEKNRADPAAKRAAVDVARNERGMTEQYVQARQLLDQGLRKLILARRSEIGHHDPQVATEFVLDQLGCQLRARLTELTFATPPATLDDEDFARETTRSVCVYLQVSPPKDN